MLLVSYDIASDKTRRYLANFLSKHGYRLQYSLFRIVNSKRSLDLIRAQIETKYAKHFGESDSVLIYETDENAMIQYGYAKHEDDDVVII